MFGTGIISVWSDAPLYVPCQISQSRPEELDAIGYKRDYPKSAAKKTKPTDGGIDKHTHTKKTRTNTKKKRLQGRGLKNVSVFFIVVSSRHKDTTNVFNIGRADGTRVVVARGGRAIHTDTHMAANRTNR